MHTMDEHETGQRFQLVIFDFDGTLADTYPWFMSIFDEFAARYHLPRLEQPALDALRNGRYRHISGSTNPVLEMTRMGSHLRKREWPAKLEQTNSTGGRMQGVIDGLHDLGIQLAVVSSNSEGNVRQVLGERNAAIFEAFECGVKLGGKKVKFEKILRRTGAAPAGH